MQIKFIPFSNDTREKEVLKAFVLQKYVPTECVERASYVLFLRGINL